MIPSVVVASARLALFFHVRDLATCRQLSITADHATACERREAEKPYETHGVLRIGSQQTQCRQFRIGALARWEPGVDRLTQCLPERPSARYYFASALFLQGKTGDAIREARRVVDAAPGHAQAQNLLGAACATLGRRDCALAPFEASIRANPRDPSTYVNLGMFHLQSADPQSASAAFAEALAVDPMSAAARDGLAQARSLLAGNPR